MSKFTDMFGKNIKAIVNYIDLDDNKKIIDSSEELEGKKGEEIDYHPSDKIKELVEQGYVLAENNFNQDLQPKFGDEDQTFEITFTHDHAIVDSSHPGFGFTKDQLEKVVKQTVHYQGAASRTPENSIMELKFNHLYEVDRITGSVIKDCGFEPAKQSFMIIGTPTLPGFVPDKAAVGGETVTPESDDKEYTVSFKINKEPSSLTQTAIIKYVDINNGNKVINVDKLTGQPNMPIEYDPKKKIAELTEDGFSLVNNGFNADGDIQFFGNSDNYEPIFIITMKYTAIAVNSDHPNDKVDKSLYEKTSKLTIKFTGAKENPADQVQTAKWTRTVTLLPTSGKVVKNGYYDTDWQSDRDHYNNVQVPVVEGYHSNQTEVAALPLSQEDQVVTVQYLPNGHIIPIDEDGTAIADAPHPQFNTDPKDPSKVIADEIVPDVNGYHCDSMTVTPSDPNHDLNVVYKADKKDDVMYVSLGKDKKEKEQVQDQDQTQESTPKQAPASENPASQAPQAESADDQAQTSSQASDNAEEKDQVAIVNFIDVDHNGASLTSSGPLIGKPGDSINDLYSTEIPLKVIKQAGYNVVFNNFDSDGFVQRFDNNDLMTQVFTIGVSKKSAQERKAEKAKNPKTVSQEINKSINDVTQKKDIDPKVKQLKETQEKLEKIRPTLVTNNSNGDTQNVSKLLDIVTALLNLVFTMGNGNSSDDSSNNSSK